MRSLATIRRTARCRWGSGWASRRARLRPQLVAGLDVAEFCEPPEIAGPGFINLKLQGRLAGRAVGRDGRGRSIGWAWRRPRAPRTIVVDYSSPNVAKPMHVGHIRSTVIGDALNRMLKFLGHRTISDNHLGDWGTQFGMIIYGVQAFRRPGDAWLKRASRS